MQKPSSFPQLPLIDRTASPLPSPSLRLVTYLDISTFKTNPCGIKVQHNHKQCQFFHFPKDRKRIGDFYGTDLCPFVEREDLCHYGDSCLKAHSRVEQLYSPSKYKSRFCSYYPNNVQNCEYGDYCSFAHQEQEISIPLIHHYEFDADFFIFQYKTVMCPFNQNKHDKSTCVYAHNWQDYRRKPQEIRYEPIPCQNWKTSDFVTNYEDGCINGFECNKCHGWKEYDFHPMNWMTKPCPKGKACNKKRECTFYHNNNEKREIAQNVQFKIFRFVPRNRILKNSFKSTDSFTNNTSHNDSGTTINLISSNLNNNNMTTSAYAYSSKPQMNQMNPPTSKTTVTFNDLDPCRTNGFLINEYDANMNNQSYFQQPMNCSWSKSTHNNNAPSNTAVSFNGNGEHPMETSFFNNQELIKMQFSSKSDNIYEEVSQKNQNLQKKTSFNITKTSDFYPNYNNLDNAFGYPNKVDPWKPQILMPEPIEEKENDGNLTPKSVKIYLKNNDSDGFGSFSPNDSNDSKLKRETSENFLSGLPPPFQLSRKNREFAEKSRFVSNFAKDDEEYKNDLFQALSEMEKFSFQKKG